MAEKWISFNLSKNKWIGTNVYLFWNRYNIIHFNPLKIGNCRSSVVLVWFYMVFLINFVVTLDISSIVVAFSYLASKKCFKMLCVSFKDAHLDLVFHSLSFNWIWSKEKNATQTPINKRVSFFYLHFDDGTHFGVHSGIRLHFQIIVQFLFLRLNYCIYFPFHFRYPLWLYQSWKFTLIYSYFCLLISIQINNKMIYILSLWIYGL